MYEFEYKRPAGVAEATGTLGADSRFLAGGQSLIQAMRLRLSQSDLLVDLGALDELRTIRREGDRLVIGAMATHASVERNEEVKRGCPALADLAGHIGDPMVRNMGTIGGSIANADPAACYPCAVLCLDAEIRTDRRSIPGASFFTGLYETALEPGELLTSVSFPCVREAAYVKFRQPASRFAMVGVFVAKMPDGVHVAVTGAKAQVFRSKEIEAALDKSFTPEAAKAVKLPSGDINADLHASSEYRAAMVSVIASRAVAAVLAR